MSLYLCPTWRNRSRNSCSVKSAAGSWSMPTSHVARLNSLMRRHRSGRHLRHLKSFQSRPQCDHRKTAHVLMIVFADMQIRSEDHLLMRIVQNHRKTTQHSSADFAGDFIIIAERHFGRTKTRPSLPQRHTRRSETLSRASRRRPDPRLTADHPRELFSVKEDGVRWRSG